MEKMELGLAGQTAVVAGAASGIGLAIAKAFANEGVTVAMLDLAEPIHTTAKEVGQQAGVETLGLQVDITEYAALTSVALQITENLGAVRHVVCAAGMGSGKSGFPFWNMEPADWARVIDVNLMGAVNIAHAFAPGLVEQRQGTMLFLSSVAGQIGSQTDPPYSAAKAAVINFSQCAARDLAPYGVRVNTLCPGMVKTPLNQGVWQGVMQNLPAGERVDYDTWAAEKIARLVPLNRWQTPEDLANMTVFLASDQARNVTGQTVNVDGGYVMHW